MMPSLRPVRFQKAFFTSGPTEEAVKQKLLGHPDRQAGPFLLETEDRQMLDPDTTCCGFLLDGPEYDAFAQAKADFSIPEAPHSLTPTREGWRYFLNTYHDLIEF